jgi:Zn-dependent protease with chaperone function
MNPDTVNTPEGGLPVGAAAAESPDLRSAILAAFARSLPPSTVSPLYRFGLAVVAFAMVLLPAVYLGLIGLTAYGVYYHATHHLSLFAGGHGGTGRMIAYAGPLAVGLILIFFLVKPFLARRTQKAESFSLTHQDEPVLFAFIGCVCRAVGAPPPSRVDVDCEVNASASFRKGFKSMFSHDVVLTIGLPLAAGLSMRQLAGVLAHEFGHFAQGAGMRLSFIIRHINHWFLRVVYERDQWDEQLQHWSRQVDFRVGIVLYVARFCVWLTRRILWVLMVLGHGISCFMLRQMEYDADSYEVKVAGSETFSSTMNRLQILNLAAQAASNDLHEGWKRRRLADNLASLLLQKAAQLPEQVRQQATELLQKRKTGWFDTHPADQDRLRAAAAAGEPGIFQLDEPATGLFRDFPALGKAATRFYYEKELGLSITDQNLAPVEETLGESNAITAGLQAISRFFPGLDPACWTLSLGETHLALPGTVAAAVEGLAAARERMEALRPHTEEICKRRGEAEERLMTLASAYHLLQAGFKLKAKEFGLLSSSLEAASEATQTTQRQLQQLAAEAADFETAARERLASALRLLDNPLAAQRLPNAEAWRREAAELTTVLIRLGEVHHQVLEIRRKLRALVTVLANVGSNQPDAKLSRQISVLVGLLGKLNGEIRSHLRGTPLPFAHARGRISVGEYLHDPTPQETELGAACQQSETCLDHYFSLHLRILGRLVMIAEQVEQSRPWEQSSDMPAP